MEIDKIVNSAKEEAIRELTKNAVTNIKELTKNLYEAEEIVRNCKKMLIKKQAKFKKELEVFKEELDSMAV